MAVHQDPVGGHEGPYLHSSNEQQGSLDAEEHLKEYILPISGIKIHFSFIGILTLN